MLCNHKGLLKGQASQGTPNHNSHLLDNLQEVIILFYKLIQKLYRKLILEEVLLRVLESRIRLNQS